MGSKGKPLKTFLRAPLFLLFCAFAASAEVVVGESGDFVMGSESSVRPASRGDTPRLKVATTRAPYSLRFDITGLQAGVPVKLSIRNLAGKSLLIWNRRSTGTELNFSWNGQDASGQSLSPGCFIADLVLPNARFPQLIQVP